MSIKKATVDLIYVYIKGAFLKNAHRTLNSLFCLKINENKGGRGVVFDGPAWLITAMP